MTARKQTKKTDDPKVYREDRFGIKHELTEKEAAAVRALSPSEPALPPAE